MSRSIIVANRLPYPLDDGWNVRTFHVVRSIARFARTTLIVFRAGDDALVSEAAAELGHDVEVVTVPPPTYNTPLRLALGAVSRWPIHVWNQESAAMRRAVRRIASHGADLCVLVTTGFERYLNDLPAGSVRVIDTHNLDSATIARYARTDPSPFRRLYARLTARKLQRQEQRLFPLVDLVWVCSDEEAAVARRLAPSATIQVAPNGVDTESFAPTVPMAIPERLLFFGRLDYSPNVDGLAYMANEILPRIREASPRVELVVVGAGDRGAADAIARRASGIRVLGRVDDIRPTLAEASVVVVPLRVGGGTRLKIVEALAAARPLVSTAIGAEGLRLAAGRDLLIADDPASFANAVLSLLRDPAAAERIGRAGRETVVARYDWGNIGAGIRRDLEGALERGSAASVSTRGSAAPTPSASARR